MTTMIDESFNQRCTVGDTAAIDYGYGDATPATTTSNDAASTSKYGYEEPANSTTDYGYADADSNQYGYGDDSNNNNTAASAVDSSEATRRRRERPRRRGSVTKYSLDATQEVQHQRDHTQQQQEQEAPTEIQFRQSGDGGVGSPDMTIPLNDDGNKERKSAGRRKKRADPSKHGYGTEVAAAAAPTTTNNNQYNSSNGAPDSAKYGYGDPAPDSSNKYGYGDDAAPSNTATSASAAEKYGYGDTAAASSATDKYGYGDTNGNSISSLGYGSSNGSADSNGEISASEPRRRPRRRGSVTKYSLDDEPEAAQQHIQWQQEDVTIPLKGEGEDEPRNATTTAATNNNADDMSEDGFSGDDMSCDALSDDDNGDNKKKKKKKKGRRLGRFRIGRNPSGMSRGSTSSK